MNKLPPPDHLDPEYLFNKYQPLRMTIYKKFKDRMNTRADREELMSSITAIFVQLVNEYDSQRGVDFPYYIKTLLNLRTYHWVTKHIKHAGKMSLLEDEIIVEDIGYQSVLQRIIDLQSIDPDIVLGEKHRRLMIGIFIDHKTLKELADEEGVPVDRIHARLYFLCKKTAKVFDKQKDTYGDDLY